MMTNTGAPKTHNWDKWIPHSPPKKIGMAVGDGIEGS